MANLSGAVRHPRWGGDGRSVARPPGFGLTPAQTPADLKTEVCCDPDEIPLYQRKLLGNLHPEILERFYGCGSPLPPGLEGATVLDLGCGTGRDVYLAAQLVGPEGRVIGLDMTDEQLVVARRHEAEQMKRFGYAHSNTSFLRGFIEDLASAGIEDDSVDVVISNCAIDLSADSAGSGHSRKAGPNRVQLSIGAGVRPAFAGGHLRRHLSGAAWAVPGRMDCPGKGLPGYPARHPYRWPGFCIPGVDGAAAAGESYW